MPRHELIDLSWPAHAHAVEAAEPGQCHRRARGLLFARLTDHDPKLEIAIQPAAELELINYVQAKGASKRKNVNIKNQELLECKKIEATWTVEKRTAVKRAQSKV